MCSNDKSKRVNVLVLDEDAKVFMVTTLSDLRIRGQRCKSVHGDLFVRPTIKGSKVKERSNYKMCQMTKVKRSMC